MLCVSIGSTEIEDWLKKAQKTKMKLEHWTCDQLKYQLRYRYSREKKKINDEAMRTINRIFEKLAQTTCVFSIIFPSTAHQCCEIMNFRVNKMTAKDYVSKGGAPESGIGPSLRLSSITCSKNIKINEFLSNINRLKNRKSALIDLILYIFVDDLRYRVDYTLRDGPC